MKTKTVKNHIDYGHGFPVHFKSAQFVKIGNEWAPYIDYKALKKQLFRMMPCRSGLLTGNEIKFIRHYMGMTLAAFGEWLGVTHAAVHGWEKKGDAPTKMEWNTEQVLRIRVARRNGTPGNLSNLIEQLEQEPAAPSEAISLHKAPIQMPRPPRQEKEMTSDTLDAFLPSISSLTDAA